MAGQSRPAGKSVVGSSNARKVAGVLAISDDDSTSLSLLRRATSGDSKAWDKLVAWCGPLVFAWCRKAMISKEDREDVFQEIFLKVHRGLGRFRHDQPDQTFRGWLLVMTRNTIIDFARRRLQQPAAVSGLEDYQALLSRAIERLADDDSKETPARTQDIRRAIALIREKFSEGVWKAFWRTAVDGLSAADAGEELGMSAEAVRKAKSRVLARLRQEFEGLLD